MYYGPLPNCATVYVQCCTLYNWLHCIFTMVLIFAALFMHCTVDDGYCTAWHFWMLWTKQPPICGSSMVCQCRCTATVIITIKIAIKSWRCLTTSSWLGLKISLSWLLMTMAVCLFSKIFHNHNFTAHRFSNVSEHAIICSQQVAQKRQIFEGRTFSLHHKKHPSVEQLGLLKGLINMRCVELNELLQLCWFAWFEEKNWLRPVVTYGMVLLTLSAPVGTHKLEWIPREA